MNGFEKTALMLVLLLFSVIVGYFGNQLVASIYDTWAKPHACQAADEYIRGWK